MNQSAERMGIFVSYSRADAVWKDSMEVHMAPISRISGVSIFIDDMMNAGENWHQTIQAELERARIVIALVSHNFLASEYIFSKELPLIVQRARNDGAHLIQVILSPCDIADEFGLQEFLAINDSSKPLSAGDEHYQNTVFSKLSMLVRELIEKSKVESFRSEGEEIAISVEQYAAEIENEFPDNTYFRHSSTEGNELQTTVEEGVGSFSREDIALALAESEPKLSALKNWVRNTLSEWKRMDNENINTYDVRIKTLDSIEEKINNRKLGQQTDNIDTEQALKEIYDLVGARILAYTPSQILSLHSQIMIHSRFNVKKIIVHYNPDFLSPYITRVIGLVESTDYKKILEKKITPSGYAAVHYVIEPDPADDIYRDMDDSLLLYDRFELQLRTVIQHAWSESEHRLIYKGEDIDNKPILKARFEMLAETINHADRLLDKVNRPEALTESRKTDRLATEPPIVAKVVDFISVLESCDISEDEAFRKTKEFTSTHSKAIAEVLQMENGNYGDRLSVAEVYLKGREYKRAVQVYEGLVDNRYADEKLYNWAIIRYVEANYAIAGSREVMHWLKILEERTADVEYLEEADVRLFITGSVKAWRHGMLDMALQMSELLLKHLDLAGENKLKVLCNDLYYRLESLHNEAWDHDPDVPDDVVQEVLALDNLTNQIIKEAESSDRTYSKNQLDTLGWFYFRAGNVYEKIDSDKAKNYYLRSNSFYKKLNEVWDRNDTTESASIWIYHMLEIRSRMNKYKE